jgi:hypothetical protein
MPAHTENLLEKISVLLQRINEVSNGSSIENLDDLQRQLKECHQQLDSANKLLNENKQILKD